MIVTGRNEVVAKVIFLHLSVILFTGGCLPQCMLGYPEQTPPGARHTPQADTHIPGADTPQDQTHPLEQTAPRDSVHPPGLSTLPGKQTLAYGQ